MLVSYMPRMYAKNTLLAAAKSFPAIVNECVQHQFWFGIDFSLFILVPLIQCRCLMGFFSLTYRLLLQIVINFLDFLCETYQCTIWPNVCGNWPRDHHTYKLHCCYKVESTQLCTISLQCLEVKGKPTLEWDVIGMMVKRPHTFGLIVCLKSKYLTTFIHGK